VRLANYADESGYCFPSRYELLKAIGCGERTLDAALSHWRKLGVIRWERGWGNQHGGQSNRYWFDEENILGIKCPIPSCRPAFIGAQVPVDEP